MRAVRVSWACCAGAVRACSERLHGALRAFCGCFHCGELADLVRQAMTPLRDSSMARRADSVPPVGMLCNNTAPNASQSALVSIC